jgi:hypothetical protein
MSYGMVICSKCQHELHQSGPREVANGWEHCDLDTPRCEGAESIYPSRERSEVKGKWCASDDIQFPF